MATTEPSPAPGSNRPPRTRTRRPRRGGHRNNGPAPADANANANTTPNSTAQVPNGPLALRPASVAPLPDSNSPAPSNPRNSNANNRGGGNGRRGGFGRGGRRGGGRGQPMANGRVFGGQLTSNSHTSPTSDAGSLAGDAPAFTPGHPIATRPGPSRAPRARRMSKSQAADLATRTHEDITNGQYECAICTNEVLPNSKIWNCKSCWSVLHLSCVKKWSKNEVSTHQQRAVENGELPPPRQWRCPGCNLPKEDLPISYTCWCEKEIEPRSVAGLPPHSCGQSCSKKRIGHCPHPCDLMCHAGPCPPCAHMGPSLPCFCGKETVSRRCLDTKYESGWACGQICDDVLPCGEHNFEKTLPCSERDEERESQAPTISAIVPDNAKTRLHHAINRAEGRKAFAITPVPMLAMPLTPKQAVKCLASKTSEGNSKKTLDCNDECLKLQRNAKLAAALNIDPSTHTDDHVPYSQQTLDMVKDMLKFCQTYEREFRVFAADPSEKRLRFKPMPSHQRAFLHSLAEDYGLDSESQDPEPHRHVSIFKTPRFVSAPLKTLAQCVKVKPVAVVEAASSKKLVATAEPFNAFLLSNPRFGLTIDEIHTDLSSEFANAGLDFDVSFLPSGEVVLRGKAPETWYTKVDSALTAMQHSLVQKVKALQLASTVVLCSVDSSLNVVRREDDHLGGGWSQVAKGASGSKAPVRPEIGVKSSFTVLGTRMAAKKKKEEQDSAVDDWEKEVEAWDA
ncbi:hypothetical protein BTUL_0115g00390 [Botrytis tulipae]|uniref:R3H domain-containing protein n=1 Tax=Botrytis tulipae TaxID=87230 RepID=A0A4Z1EJA8_9HELO|nr:hypothetical protein BTUL_0115g00390 [Botrytis tulipae]